MMKSLKQLYAEHEGKVSDKWSFYLAEYDRLFLPYRELPVRMLEIGIQNGGSLEVWSKYFRQAQVLIGCDINPDCSALRYDDTRVHVVVGDANQEETLRSVLSINSRFDLIIDDGSHTSSDIIKSFLLYFPQLEDGGLFIAEDLHCSYWGEFQGGLFDPFSSIAFFKRLADVINHEHWGVERDAASILSGILNHYRCDVEPDVLSAILASVHAVEFVNSICVIRKAKPRDNVMGPRFIAGQVEDVVPNHHGLHLSQGVAPGQTYNRWNTMPVPPDEQYAPLAGRVEALERALGERDVDLRDARATLASAQAQIKANSEFLKRAEIRVREHDDQISAYHRAVLERDAMIEALRNSRSWRITAPLRRVGSMTPRLRYRLVGLHRLVERDGAGALIGKAWRIYRRHGLAGLRQRASLTLHGVHAAVEAARQDVTLRPTEEYLPVGSISPEAPRQVGVDVIIPVYRGLVETRNCIESVLAAKNVTRARVVVIDDCSPEPEVTAWLQALPQSADFVVLRNEENLGFVGTVNRGMSLAADRDVVLLNSDTEVADEWLDRLVRHAYSAEKISSVTPFSNNATICSYPRLEGTRKLPADETLASINRAFWEANAGRSMTLPTAIGFCMYIRRDSMDELGLFDVEAFGKGYGEENDFCLRGIAAGWRHLLAADTFVYHAGEVSFQDSSSPGKARAMDILRSRYPDYERSVADHVQEGEPEPARIAATAARYRLSELPVTLMIGHHLGGGTEKHLIDLSSQIKSNARTLILMPRAEVTGGVVLSTAAAEDGLRLALRLPEHASFLVKLLKSFGVSRTHIHHLLGFPEVIRDVVTSLDVPFDFTVHDYFSICPQINLAIEGRYCGEPDAGGCNQCIAARPSQGAQDIVWWRQRHAWVIDDAERVICPSHDVATRVLRYRPTARTLVAAHETLSHGPLSLPALEQGEPLRVVLLGWLARHKGARLVTECIAHAQKLGKKSVHFHLIGRSSDEMPLSDLYSETGEYEDTDLDRLIAEADPHVIWLASTWPETYSYTLSGALTAGRPVVVPDIGAFPERVSGREWSWVVPWNWGGDEFFTFFDGLRSNFETRTPPSVPDWGEPPPAGFYESGYLAPIAAGAAGAPIDLRRPGLHTVLAVVEFLGDKPSPCAYIRVLLPLSVASAEHVNVRIVRADEVTRYVADALYTHRIAVHGADTETVVEHCRAHDIRLIYDLDDDLIGIAQSSHPERDYYATFVPGIRKLVESADEVRVSTAELRERLRSLNPDVVLVPNALDASSWLLDRPSPTNGRSSRASVLYMGTLTHAADFNLVKNALKRAKKAFGDRLDVNIIGVTADRDDPDLDWCHFVDVPPHASSSYPAFAEWLAGLGTFTIGIAPLVDSEFNRGKSAIKFFDYAALGLAVIGSDVEAYRHAIRHEQNGLLIPNDEQAWYEAIERLLTDEPFRAQLAAEARRELIAEHTLQSAKGGAPFMLEWNA